MYESKGEPREFLGTDRAEAVAKACSYFGLGEGDLEIVEVPPGKVSGLAGRVLIVAYPRGYTPGKGGGGDQEGGRRRGREGRGGRGGERGGRDRGDGRRRRDRGPRRGSAAGLGEAQEEVAGPSEGKPLTELGAVAEFVRGAIERMRVGPFEISDRVEGELRVVQVRGPAAERLSAGDGRAADALQLLAREVSVRQGDEEPRVVLEIEGDPERREQLLERIAARAADRARSSGRAVALDPMSPRDRRAVHLALRDAEGIATMSIGSGRFRQVVVVPEGAPEYEEARRQEETAATRDEESG